MTRSKPDPDLWALGFDAGWTLAMNALSNTINTEPDRSVRKAARRLLAEANTTHPISRQVGNSTRPAAPPPPLTNGVTQ